MPKLSHQLVNALYAVKYMFDAEINLDGYSRDHLDKIVKDDLFSKAQHYFNQLSEVDAKYYRGKINDLELLAKVMEKVLFKKPCQPGPFDNLPFSPLNLNRPELFNDLFKELSPEREIIWAWEPTEQDRWGRSPDLKPRTYIDVAYAVLKVTPNMMNPTGLELWSPMGRHDAWCEIEIDSEMGKVIIAKMLQEMGKLPC